MGQTRLRDYLNPILSFNHNLFNLGMHNPGRYAGYDTVNWTALNALTFLIAHTNTGINYKDQNESVKGPNGVALSPQGGLIMESAPVGDDNGNPLALVTNAGNSFTRYDILVMSHSYVVEPGGQDALYSIVQGPIGASTIPTVADPLHDIIIGIFEIAADASGSNGTITWTPSRCPDSGDGEDARLELINTFSKLQQWNTSSTNYTAGTTSYSNYGGTGITGKGLSLKTDGNTFRVIPTSGSPFNLAALYFDNVPLQDGVKISLVVNQYLTTIFNSTVALPSADYNDGYRAIMGNVAFQTGTVLGTSNQIVPVASATWELQLRYDIHKTTAGGQTGAWIIIGVGMMDDPTKFTPGIVPQYPWSGAPTSSQFIQDTGYNFNVNGAGTISNSYIAQQVLNNNSAIIEVNFDIQVTSAGNFAIKIPVNYAIGGGIICGTGYIQRISTAGQVIDILPAAVKPYSTNIMVLLTPTLAFVAGETFAVACSFITPIPTITPIP